MNFCELFFLELGNKLQRRENVFVCLFVWGDLGLVCFCLFCFCGGGVGVTLRIGKCEHYELKNKH